MSRCAIRPKESEQLHPGTGIFCSPRQTFRQPAVRLAIRNRNSPLYSSLYPRTHSCSQKPSAVANRKVQRTLVNIERISDCRIVPNGAKSAFLDFQSSALPTELPSQPFRIEEV